MLMSLGPVRFEIYPFNTTGYGHDHETSFVEKPVLGARPPLEWVGEGSESWSITAQMGWVVVEKVAERSSHLDAKGIGRVVDVDITVHRAAKPSDGSFFSLFSGMFS